MGVSGFILTWHVLVIYLYVKRFHWSSVYLCGWVMHFCMKRHTKSVSPDMLKCTKPSVEVYHVEIGHRVKVCHRPLVVLNRLMIDPLVLISGLLYPSLRLFLFCLENYVISGLKNFSRVFSKPQIEIENPASDWEKEYSWYINRWYSLENVNIYILFIDSSFYLYPREKRFTMYSLFQ